MAKQKFEYVCQSCGYKSAKWLGKCPECEQWNSFQEEELILKKGKSQSLDRRPVAKIISEIEHESFARYITTIKEFDRVVGGGICHGSLSLVGGEPGIGKSTLLMEVCGKILSQYTNCKILYVSGEESLSQVADRSKRLGIKSDGFYILNENNWQRILEVIKDVKPSFLVLDSIQTTYSSEVESAAGTLSQIREVTYELMNQSKVMGITSFVIGHVTKEGQIAGPKILEHMVDTVIYFEGDQMGHYRLLRVLKNRFGTANEVGIFEMTESGLREVKNPSQYFIQDGDDKSYGRSLTCILEGTRNLMVELQALVVENKFAVGRRVSQGIDSNRVSLLIAVIDKYFSIPLSYNDIYVNVVGGMKISGREADLSVVASLLSSYYSRVLPSQTVFLGEVGLTGEVRSIPMIETRLKELTQLDYKQVVLPHKSYLEFKDKFSIKMIGIKKAEELKGIFFN